MRIICLQPKDKEEEQKNQNIQDIQDICLIADVLDLLSYLGFLHLYLFKLYLVTCNTKMFNYHWILNDRHVKQDQT